MVGLLEDLKLTFPKHRGKCRFCDSTHIHAEVRSFQKILLLQLHIALSKFFFCWFCKVLICIKFALIKTVLFSLLNIKRGAKPANLKIRAGSSSNTEGGQIIGIQQVYRHEKFNRQKIDYDYAVLQLNESIKFDATKQAIKLHDFGEVFSDGTMAMTSGWGNTQDNSDQSKLRRGELELKLFEPIFSFKCAINIQ